MGCWRRANNDEHVEGDAYVSEGEILGEQSHEIADGLEDDDSMRYIDDNE